MAYWKHELQNGNALRKAIYDEDIEKILNTLKDCYTEVSVAMPDYFDEDDLEDKIADIDNELDNYYNYANYDMTLQDVEDNVDGLLNNFYDFCDDLKVWVNL